MTGPKGPQGINGPHNTYRGIGPVATFPRRADEGLTPGSSYEGPSAPPPSGVIIPLRPPIAPPQLAPHPPAMPATRKTPPPMAFSQYSIDGVSAAANKLVRAAARDLPSEQSSVTAEKILSALFEYWQERSPLLQVVGTPPESSWTYQDVIDRRVELECDYASLIASAETLWLEQNDETTRRSETDYIEYMRELLTQRLDPEKISFYVDQNRISAVEIKLLQAFHDLANALLFYKSAQVVTTRVDKIVLLTSGASMAGEKALHRFGDMDVPPVIQEYSQTLLVTKIAPAISRLGEI